jgi:hypothetical protein
MHRNQLRGMEMKKDDTSSDIRIDEIRLMQLVAMFQMAAMQQMGKLVNPVTNEVERDLDQARASIDMIETLKRKTEGNRSPGESEFFDKILFELHMNYVDETRRGPDTGDGKAGGGAAKAEESAAADAGGDNANASETTDPET